MKLEGLRFTRDCTAKVKCRVSDRKGARRAAVRSAAEALHGATPPQCPAAGGNEGGGTPPHFQSGMR